MKLINHTPFVIFLGEAILNILLNCEDWIRELVDAIPNKDKRSLCAFKRWESSKICKELDKNSELLTEDRPCNSPYTIVVCSHARHKR
jgi:hypothetical protein